METIGKEKITMSLDDIIAMEPLRYTAPPGTMPNRDVLNTKAYRPKVYGRLQHEPYKQGLMQRNENRRPISISQPRPSPYDHNSFKFNGVHVSENSALLNRRVGEVEIVARPQTEDDYDIEEAEDESDEDVKPPPNIGVPLCPALETQHAAAFPNEAEPRLYTDLNYVRLPVHQRLGWSSDNQFRKSRVQHAAKFLRLRQTQKPQAMNKKQFPQFQRFPGKNARKQFMVSGRKRKGAVDANGMQVSFVNELAMDQRQPKPLLEINPMETRHLQPLMDIVTMPPPTRWQQPHLIARNNAQFLPSFPDNKCTIAPLIRQNVERLPGGGVLQSGASSFLSSFTNEEEILERICNVENLVSKLASNPAAMSIVDSGQVNQGAVLLPVAGGGLQAYVPLVATAGGVQQTGCTAFQGHIVQAQEDGTLVVQSTADSRRVMANGRISRQLMAAAKRQPLTQEIQERLWETRAAFRCNNHERASRDSFTYRPMPHATQCSTNERIKLYAQLGQPNQSGRNN